MPSSENLTVAWQQYNILQSKILVEFLLPGMPEINPKEIYTTKEAQDFLKISSSTFKRLLKRGIIKAYKVGGTYRIWGSEILKLVSPKLESKVYMTYKKVKEKTKKTIEKW
ncbi:MAG: helix-turn-helix domain-containing protein [Patescibacteria group bacterium]|nr:helix-turn-helix domain-containing protein [Patescibacteria group bacterium]